MSQLDFLSLLGTNKRLFYETILKTNYLLTDYFTNKVIGSALRILRLTDECASQNNALEKQKHDEVLRASASSAVSLCIFFNSQFPVIHSQCRVKIH